MSVNPNPPADPQPNPPAPPVAGPSTTDPPAGEPSIPKSRFDEVNNELKRLRKAEEDRTKADQKAVEDRAKEQGEYQKLADTFKAKAEELEPFKVKAERYEQALAAQLETLKKDLPEYALAALEGRDVADQLEYLAKYRDALVGSANGATAPKGAPNSPKPAGAPSASDAVNEHMQRLRRSGQYSRF